MLFVYLRCLLYLYLMAAPIPENQLIRKFEAEYLLLEGLIEAVDRDAIIARIDADLATAGRTYACPKCGGNGYHPAREDDPSILPEDDYPIRCTMGLVSPIYEADPTVKCLGWGLLTIGLKYKVTTELETI